MDEGELTRGEWTEGCCSMIYLGHSSSPPDSSCRKLHSRQSFQGGGGGVSREGFLGNMEEGTRFREKFTDKSYAVVFCNKRMQVLDCIKTAFQTKLSSVQKRTRQKDNVPS